jgi:hypothetical protein
MKIEEVANTFFKWRPLIFLMEFSWSDTLGFWASREVFLCARIPGIRSLSATVRRKHHLRYTDYGQQRQGI